MNLVNGLVGTDSRFGDLSDFPRQHQNTLFSWTEKCHFAFKGRAALLDRFTEGMATASLLKLSSGPYPWSYPFSFVTKTWKWFAVVFSQDVFLASQSWHFLEVSYSIVSNPIQLFKISQNRLGKTDISQPNEVGFFFFLLSGLMVEQQERDYS